MGLRKGFVGAVFAGIIISIAGCGGEETVAVGGNPDPVVTNTNTNTDPVVTNGNTTDATTKSNVAPTISGTPVLIVREGGSYHFAPISADADNDELTFSVQNKPEWMAFDPVSGELTGTPLRTDVGEYTEIEVSVTDGETTTSLDSFVVVVKSTSATLSWVAPLTRTDGSPLSMTDIGGYKVYMGGSATDLTLVANVSDPYTMEYEISSLDDGVYYFAVSTTSIDGIESDLSAVVSKRI